MSRSPSPTPAPTRQGAETRARLVQAAVTLFQSQGYHATGVAAILAHAGVPKGSMYHHFPGGKQALTIAAVNWLAEDNIARFSRAAQDAPSADVIITRLFNDWAASLEAHGYAQGALMSLLAQEVEPQETALRATIAQTYRDATTQLAEVLETAGANAPEELATTVLAALDGAIARARAQRSTVGLHRAADILSRIAKDA